MAKLESFLFMDQICSAQDTMGTTVLVLSDAAWMWSVQHLSVIFLWILLRQLSYYAIFLSGLSYWDAEGTLHFLSLSYLTLE